MLNLTVDLFGHSVNLMEVGGRVEGAEHLIESLFGPNGYFPENAVSTALRRARRSADNDRLDRVHDRVSSKVSMSGLVPCTDPTLCILLRLSYTSHNVGNLWSTYRPKEPG